MKTIQQLALENIKKLQALEMILGYRFSDSRLLQQALVHSSFGFEQLADGLNNETFEFMGDAVLDLAVSDMLLQNYPGAREGELTKMRAGLVREATLAQMARNMKLGDFLMLGRGEEASHGRRKTSILAGTFEALIGAMYLDSGYDKVRNYIMGRFESMLLEKKQEIITEDAKSRLQETLQEKYNLAPTYHVDAEEGPDHAKKFTISVRFMTEVLGTGFGSSKKVAEQEAAAQALATVDSWWEKIKVLHDSVEN